MLHAAQHTAGTADKRTRQQLLSHGRHGSVWRAAWTGERQGRSGDGETSRSLVVDSSLHCVATCTTNGPTVRSDRCCSRAASVLDNGDGATERTTAKGRMECTAAGRVWELAVKPLRARHNRRPQRHRSHGVALRLCMLVRYSLLDDGLAGVLDRETLPSRASRGVVTE